MTVDEQKPRDQPASQSCSCGEATCKEPWEPGCGIGRSEAHVASQSAPSDGGGEIALEDRVEFALRDAGFDYDEAFRISRLATAGQVDDAMVERAWAAYSGEQRTDDPREQLRDWLVAALAAPTPEQR